LQIDLHAHTTESDGTSSPRELVNLALQVPLRALAVTDHDTLSGYELALPAAQEAGLELICGIELSTKLDNGRSAHLLGYFVNQPPSTGFRDWLDVQQQNRHNRNVSLIEKLNALGMPITLEEVQAEGRPLTGRPHFARVLVRKGFARDAREAFDLYLADHARAAVDREQVPLLDGIERLRQSGAAPVLAHPIRLPQGQNDEALGELLGQAREAGLQGLECYHSEHQPEDTARFLVLARKLSLKVTGGSDFHGANKPDIGLGTGRDGNISIPYELLTALRES
jgi:predicted metal-dependent phosphoesterase TrpH